LNSDAYTQSRLRVYWTIPDNNGGQAITTYAGETEDVTSGGVTPYLNANDAIVDPATPNVMDAYLEGLTRGNQYRFRVAAHNSKGFGDWSDWTLTTGPQAGFVMQAPLAVTNLRRHSDAPVTGKIKLIWNTPTVADAGGEQPANLVYDIYYQAAQTGSYLVAGSTTGTVTFEQDGVPAGQINNYKVTLTNRAGYSTQTATEVALKSGEGPGQITVFTIESSVYQTLSMTWEPPTTTGGEPLLGYQVSSDNECDANDPCPTVEDQLVFEVPLSDCTGVSPTTCSFTRTWPVEKRVGRLAVVTFFVRAKNSVASAVPASASSAVCVGLGGCPPGNLR